MLIRAHAPSNIAAAEAKRILIVDDNADVGEALGDLLQFLGYETVIVNSVKAARASLERGSFDAVLSDLMMPGESGFDFARWLRAHPAASVSELPALAISATSSADDRCRALRAGFDGFVAKPCDLPDLHRALSTVLRRFS